MSGNTQLRFTRVLMLACALCAASMLTTRAEPQQGRWAPPQPTNQRPTNQRPTNQQPANQQTDLARLMLRDAQQWAKRGFKNAAINLAERAARLEANWQTGEPTPETLLRELRGEQAAPDPTAALSKSRPDGEASPNVASANSKAVQLPHDFLNPAPGTAHAIQQASFVEAADLGIPRALPPVQPMPAAVPQPAAASPQQIHLILGNGFQGQPKSEVASVPPNQPAPTGQTPTAAPGPQAEAKPAPNDSTWRMVAFMLFAALALVLLRDARMPGRVQIQVTNPTSGEDTPADVPTPAANTMRRRS